MRVDDPWWIIRDFLQCDLCVYAGTVLFTSSLSRSSSFVSSKPQGKYIGHPRYDISKVLMLAAAHPNT